MVLMSEERSGLFVPSSLSSGLHLLERMARRPSSRASIPGGLSPSSSSPTPHEHPSLCVPGIVSELAGPWLAGIREPRHAWPRSVCCRALGTAKGPATPSIPGLDHEERALGTAPGGEGHCLWIFHPNHML